MYGKFKLSSGRLSRVYVQLNALMGAPRDLEQLAIALAQKILAHHNLDCNVIMSPALGAIIPGYEVAKYMDRRYVFCERDESRKFSLRRGFQLESNDKVLIVENVVTTGGSAFEAAAVASSLGAHVVGVASLIDRGGGAIIKRSGLEFVSLVEILAEDFDPSECPADLLEGAIKPGSRW